MAAPITEGRNVTIALVVIAGLIGVLPSGFPASALDTDPLPTVRLTVELPDQQSSFESPSGLTLETPVDDPVNLRIQVYETGDPGSPVSVDDPTVLLEIRTLSDPGSGVRLGDMREVSPGTYTTTYAFTGPGHYEIEVLPDVEDRSRLSSETTDRVRFDVGAPSSAPLSTAFPTILAGAALAALVGALVLVMTRGRPRANKPPVTHDTWWNGP